MPATTFSTTPNTLGAVTCPVCRTPLNVPLVSIIDVQKQPELKLKLLQGTLNAFTCPKCGASGVLSAPLLYHDGSKQILFVLTPANMNMKGQDSQKLLGSLTNALMASLPPEQRKAYLFQPKTFLTPESMVQAILEADGITKEMIEAQKKKVSLLSDLMSAVDDDARFKDLVAQNQDLFDEEFFDILYAVISSAEAEGQQEIFDDLLQLRQKLLPLTKIGQQAIEEEKRLRKELAQAKADLLQRVVETNDEKELEGLVQAGRPLMDYAFFQHLADMIDQASSKEAKRLIERRAKILEISERQDEAEKQILVERADLLKRALQSPEPESVLRAEVGKLDDAFFTILSINLREATRAGQSSVVAKLRQISDVALAIIRENAPPVVKLINLLFEAKYPEETQTLLNENRETARSKEFMETLGVLAQELKARGENDAVEKLEKIAVQAESMSRER